MIYDSLVQRHELFFATATVAAHANAGGSSFRQRDVKFLIELFSNWLETSLPGYMIEVKNTQVSRFLVAIVADGYARRISRKGHPTYRLTRTGLVELIARVVDKYYISEREQFFFLYFFIKNYRHRIEQLVKNEGRQFPPSLKIELDLLLDSDNLLQKEVAEANKELQKLQVRINAAKETSKYIRNSVKRGAELASVVKEVEHLYPYELNSQKPLTELIESIPEDMRQWELDVGNRMRIDDIWRPTHTMLTSYIAALKQVKEKSAAQ